MFTKWKWIRILLCALHGMHAHEGLRIQNIADLIVGQLHSISYIGHKILLTGSLNTNLSPFHVLLTAVVWLSSWLLFGRVCSSFPQILPITSLMLLTRSSQRYPLRLRAMTTSLQW